MNQNESKKVAQIEN